MANPQAEPRIQEIVSRLIAEALTTSTKGLALWEPGEAMYLQENMLTVLVNIEGDGKTFRSAFANMNITRDQNGTHYTMTAFITNFYGFRRILSWNVIDDGDREIEDESHEKQIYTVKPKTIRAKRLELEMAVTSDPFVLRHDILTTDGNLHEVCVEYDNHVISLYVTSDVNVQEVEASSVKRR